MRPVLLVGATQVVTCRGPAEARRGPAMTELEVLTDAAVLVDGRGLIAALGPYRELKTSGVTTVEVNGVLFPGFVDAHTHGVFGAPRLADHERRARGTSYQQIAAEGGGILSSVRSLREQGPGELLDRTRRRLNTLLAHGSTTVEVKSGYGLSLEQELKQLDVIGQLAETERPSLIATFLGAHEVPPEDRPATERYLNRVIGDMLPAVRRQGVARFCDVFCEPGVFTVEQSRRLLEAARALGFGLKLHADELAGSGGAELAAELGAISADHLAAVSEQGIAALAASQTIAVLLPGTMWFLGKRTQAPARRLIDAGSAVALASDFNPGSSPGMSLPLMAMCGVSQMGMLPPETIIAITVNGAAAVGEAQTRGQIAPGFRADLALAAVRDWRELPYWYGVNLITEVWVRGRACHPWKAPVDFPA